MQHRSHFHSDTRSTVRGYYRKQKFQDLTAQGISIPRIADQLHIPSGSVHKYVVNTPELRDYKKTQRHILDFNQRQIIQEGLGRVPKETIRSIENRAGRSREVIKIRCEISQSTAGIPYCAEIEHFKPQKGIFEGIMKKQTAYVDKICENGSKGVFFFSSTGTDDNVRSSYDADLPEPGPIMQLVNANICDYLIEQRKQESASNQSLEKTENLPHYEDSFFSSLESDCSLLSVHSQF